MSDNGNNSNQEDPSGLGPQNSTSYLNRQSSFNPNSSDMSYGNNYSSYNRLPSSYSSMNDSYGGYSSSYGGYGGSTGYGGYGGGYGGYNRGYGGYSSYGNSSYTNQYSNHYSKPLPPDQQNQQQNQQIPPPNFRQDMWGFLNGFHAMLNVLYAATGIVHFGKIFMRMSLKIIKMVCGKSIGLVFKLTGFKFLKKILMGLSTTDNWSSEFNFSEQPFENAWRTDDRVNNSTIFGKIMLVLRICSLLGTGLALFLRSKMRHQHPPVQAETLGPDVPSLEGPQINPINSTDFEKVKNFYEDIRVIEDDNNFANQQNLASVLNATLEQGMQEAETFVQVLEEDDKSVTENLSPEEEPIKVVCETSPESSSDVVESQATTTEKEETAVKVVDTDTVADSINTKEEITFPIIEKIQHAFSAEPIVGIQTETVKADTVSSQDTPVTKDSISSTPQDAIISEDFWKNQEVYKTIENLQKEEQKPEKKEFELPSVLQTLRSSSTPASKPWLMKKKKTVEVSAETPQQAQTSPVENLKKVPEVQETPEVVKAEKVTETPDVTPEVKVETQLMENLEGTTV